MNLNLGCSDSIHPDFLNVDIHEPPSAVPFEKTDEWRGKFERVDLRKKFPWEDSVIDIVRAHDILEHLPSKVRTMNEIHRVLKPGGKLELFIPTTDGRGAWQDPTHVSFWTPNDLFYFCDFAEWKRFHESNGTTALFRTEDPAASVRGPDGKMGWDKPPYHTEFADKVWKLKIVLVAVK